MTPSQIATACRTAIRIKRPIFIWGPPGVGKSDVVEGIAEQDDLQLIDFRMALRDPTDIKGFPMPDQKTGTMKFFRDGELPTAGKGILFMDELNSAAPATQAAGMQLTLTRQIGDYRLPDGWSIIAAGNRDGDRGVTHRMPAPLANRFTHLDFDVSVDDWIKWAMGPGAQAPELIAFFRLRGELLHKQDTKLNAHAFPTPRSWVAAEEIRKEESDKTVAYEMIKGTVGDGPAAEYWSFLTLIAELPSVDEIRLNPDSALLPDSPSTQWAISTALAVATTDTSFGKFMEYMKRMPTEYQATYVRDAMRKVPALRTSKVFTKWSLANEEVLS